MQSLFSRALLSILLLLMVPWAHAQYPSRPVRVIIPFGAGGPTDLVGRVLAHGLGELWGRPVVVENRPGAGGNIGTDAVAKSAPDGYTLLVVPSGLLVINPWLFEKMPFHPQKDLTPISMLGSGPNILFVNSRLSINTLADYVRYAREHPGKSNYSSAGIGTIPHLVGEMLVQQTGINIVHVPYGGGPQSTGALLSGDTDIAVDTPTALSHVKAGKIRPLAVLAKNRISAAPEIPTAAEAGYPGMAMDAWYGLLAPAGMPANLVRQLHADAERVLSSPEARKRLEPLAFEATLSTPDAFAKAIAAQGAQWGEVFRKAGIRPQ